MRRMTLIGIFLTLPLVFCGCSKDRNNDKAITTAATGADQEESTAEDINGMSIFQLPSTWRTQNNEEIEFKDLKGNVLVVVMIYTSCQSACPRLVADMKGIELKVSSAAAEDVKYILVSIDPAYDTPEKLKQFSIDNEMSDPKWLFLQGTEETVRDFANVLAVRYTQISPMDFSHSNIISVFDQGGVMQHQQEGLGVDYQRTVNAILSLAGKRTAINH